LGRLGVPADRVTTRSGELFQVRLDEGLGSRQAGLERLAAIRPDEGVGVLAGREECRPTPETGFQEGGKAARRRPPPVLVAVEAGDHALAQAAEPAELVHGDGGPERRDPLLDLRLRTGNDVEVALDQDRPARTTDRLPRLEEPVQHLSLAEERRLGGVEVLGRRVASRGSTGKNPPAEGHYLAGRVRDRKDQPVAEAIEDAPRTCGAIASQDETGRDGILGRKGPAPQVARERFARTRGIP